MSAAVLTRQATVRPVTAPAAATTERGVRRAHRAAPAPTAVRRPASRPHPDRRTRLTRTLVLGTVLLAGLLVVLAAVWSPTAAAEEAGAAQPTVSVVVEEGDSLWTVVEEQGYDRDPRTVVDEVRSLNGMSTGVVHPGQILEVPAR